MSLNFHCTGNCKSCEATKDENGNYTHIFVKTETVTVPAVTANEEKTYEKIIEEAHKIYLGCNDCADNFSNWKEITKEEYEALKTAQKEAEK